jgi:hypothetical protein
MEWKKTMEENQSTKFNLIGCDTIVNSPSFCQNHTPGETWELTLLSHGTKNKKNMNDPHPNSPRRGCARVLKFCMQPTVTKRIGLYPKNKKEMKFFLKNKKEMKSVQNCLKCREI